MADTNGPSMLNSMSLLISDRDIKKIMFDIEVQPVACSNLADRTCQLSKKCSSSLRSQNRHCKLLNMDKQNLAVTFCCDNSASAIVTS